MTQTPREQDDDLDPLLREQAEQERRLRPDDHAALGRLRSDFGLELWLVGYPEHARAACEDALIAYRRAVAETPTAYTFIAEMASTHDVLAVCVLEDLGRGQEAREHGAAALAMLKRLRDVVDHEIRERESASMPAPDQPISGGRS